jgi:hypothetical protein
MYEIAGKKIASTLAEIVDPAHTALLIWDMEYAIAPNAFNYKDLLPKLQEYPPWRGVPACEFFIRCRPDSIWRKKKPASGCASG